MESCPVGKTFETFPLLLYAAKQWPNHSRLQQSSDVATELSFLSRPRVMRSWFFVYQLQHALEAGGGRVGSSDLPSIHTGTSLFYASLFGLEAVVATLIATGADVNADEGHLGNALQAAIRQTEFTDDKSNIVQMLLDAGADVNIRGGEYGHSLQTAATCMSYTGEKYVRLLVHAGADVNAVGGRFGNALQAAAYTTSHEVVELLIGAGANVNAVGGEYGHALQAASDGRNAEIVRMLLKAGADVNNSGCPFRYHGAPVTALQMASAFMTGNEEIVQMLIDSGADVNAVGRCDSITALRIALEKRHTPTIRGLLKAGAKVTCNSWQTQSIPVGTRSPREGLPTSSQDGRMASVIRSSTPEPVNPQTRRSAVWRESDSFEIHYGMDDLQVAVDNGDAEVIRLILDAGADINAPGRRTALARACERPSEEVVQMLLDAGADVNDTGTNGRTALSIAISQGHEHIVQLLLEAGADVNVTDKFGDTALLRAASGGYEQIVQILLDAGAQVNAGRRLTALHGAAVVGHTSLVERLIGAGADVNSTTSQGITALQFALVDRHRNTAQSLLRAGAHVSESPSPLHAAAILKLGQTVGRTLNEAGDVNATSCAQQLVSALHGASYRSYAKVIRALFDNDLVDINSQRQHGSCDIELPKEYFEFFDLIVASGVGLTSHSDDEDDPIDFCGSRSRLWRDSLKRRRKSCSNTSRCSRTLRDYRLWTPTTRADALRVLGDRRFGPGWTLDDFDSLDYL